MTGRKFHDFYLGEVQTNLKDWRKLESGEYLKSAGIEDFFTNWVWEEYLSDDWYDDEDRANCYYRLYYVNRTGSIETSENSLMMPIRLDSAICLSKKEYKNVLIEIFTIINDEEDEIDRGFDLFTEFMYWKGKQKVVVDREVDRQWKESI